MACLAFHPLHSLAKSSSARQPTELSTSACCLARRHLYQLAHRVYGSKAEPDAEAAEKALQAPEWAQEALRFATVEQWFHEVVGRHFYGSLRPPFNETAREAAGFEKSWYMPLATAPKPNKPQAT